MILVLGGAGYIGSHAVRELLDKNYQVVVLDNLSTGYQQAVDKRAIFIKGNVGDAKVLSSIFSDYQIDVVMHFAAASLVSESVKSPLYYYENNVANTLTLLKVMESYEVNKLIFSSTAAVYGDHGSNGIFTEQSLAQPINPYGRSKLIAEQMIDDSSKVNDLSYVVFRYFNAAGAHPSGKIGENHQPETHLLPLILKHILGESPFITVYGDDYDTKDGTCIRDYIHVMDIIRAHIIALEQLLHDEPVCSTYNLGSGTGYSVKEVIKMCEVVTKKPVITKISDRREGDPGLLIASTTKVKQELGWEPEFTLKDIVTSAWEWHR